MLTSCDSDFEEIIRPFTWNFFNDVHRCLVFLRTRLPKPNPIFLIASGSLGYEFLASSDPLSSRCSFVYIYCAQLGRHEHWVKDCSQVRGIFNDSLKLSQQIKADLGKNLQAHTEKNQSRSAQSKGVSQVRTDQMRSNLANFDEYLRFFATLSMIQH